MNRPLQPAAGHRPPQDHRASDGEDVYLVVIDEYAYYSATVGKQDRPRRLRCPGPRPHRPRPRRRGHPRPGHPAALPPDHRPVHAGPVLLPAGVPLHHRLLLRRRSRPRLGRPGLHRRRHRPPRPRRGLAALRDRRPAPDQDRLAPPTTPSPTSPPTPPTSAATTPHQPRRSPDARHHLTAAAAALSPEPVPGPGPGADADDTQVISWADFRAWERQLASSGACAHPIRLRGRIDAIDLATGEIAPSTTPTTSPAACCTVACGNRRESVCPACSQVYKRDARQLVRAGLTGGKGIPESVTTHPCVFATLTAPRSARCTPAACAARPCCPAAPAATPPTAAARTAATSPAPPATPTMTPGSASPCARTATTTTPPSCSTPTPPTCGAGSPPTCPATWPAAGITQKTLRSMVRIRFVKVAEYQARGLVHFHAIIRLDAPGEDYQPPPPGITAAAARPTPSARPPPPSASPSCAGSSPPAR